MTLELRHSSSSSYFRGLGLSLSIAFSVAVSFATVATIFVIHLVVIVIVIGSTEVVILGQFNGCALCKLHWVWFLHKLVMM